MRCNSCGNNVTPCKRFSWFWFIMLCLTGIGGVFYLMWYLIKPEDSCPVCKRKLG